MARGPPLLASHAPTIAPTSVAIGHVQLRDLIICPHERGVVNYVHDHSIVEHDVKSLDSSPRVLVDLSFLPNTIASLPVLNSDDTLLAAGGQDAEIHISLHAPGYSDDSSTQRKLVWRFEAPLPGSINNSVLLTSMSLTRSNETSIEPRVGISNNDCTVKFYDIPVRSESAPKTIKDAGSLRLDVPVNHSSISPDGRTLLSVGDSAKVHLHHLTGGSRITFTPITTLNVPPPDNAASQSSSALAASFSTAFSSNGSKFAVASQEGVVAVWDVRSTKPLKVFQTDKTRSARGKSGGNGMASGWLSDDPWDWTRGGSKAPGWGARNVKFGAGGCNGNPGRELMTFTEHTSLVHVIDAWTFEQEEIIRVPSSSGNTHVPTPLSPRLSYTRSDSPRYHQPTSSPSSRPTPSHPQPPPPPPPRIVLALEETFRIPSSSSRSRLSGTGSSSPASRRHHFQQRNSAANQAADEEDEGVVVIPPLGDWAVENDVRQLLGRHGIQARHAETQPETVYEEDGGAEGEYFVNPRPDGDGDDDEHADVMEVDELESDYCVSSHTPSRSSSPSPSSHAPAPSPARLSPHTPRHHYRGHRLHRMREADQDLDLAGTCFDPSGGHLYVATLDGIAEWNVRGSEKRWWAGSQWA